MGCEFRDAPDTTSPSAHRTDLTFKWADDVGAKEVKRSFISLNGELGNSAKLALAALPKALTVLGIGGGRDCVANVWVHGESNVHLDCITIEGRDEITLRGFDLALEDGLDGIHPVRVEIDGPSGADSKSPRVLNFPIRTLPRSLDVTRTEISSKALDVGTTAGFHQVGELSVRRSLVGKLALHWPTKAQAAFKRRLVRHDYNFDFIRCVISQKSTDASETHPLEVWIIEISEPIRKEWPKLFSLESQNGNLDQSENTTLSLFAKHPYLDKVFGPTPFKESASIVRVEKECAPDRAVLRAPAPVELFMGAPIPRSTHAFVRIGIDEEDPVLEFDLQGLEVADHESLALDANPVRRTLASNRFEIVLQKGVSR